MKHPVHQHALGAVSLAAALFRRDQIEGDAVIAVAKDFALIRSELGTCRNILQRMSADAGQAMGEQPVDDRFVGLITRIGQEGVQFFEGGRQARQAQGDPAQQLLPPGDAPRRRRHHPAYARAAPHVARRAQGRPP